jgi:putative copper resistance protein D
VGACGITTLLVLFGAALFTLYDGPQPGDARTQAWLAWSAVLTGCCWIIISLADMADGIESLFSMATWQTFLQDTGSVPSSPAAFGWVWTWRLAALVALLVCALLASSPLTTGEALVVGSLSAVLLISLGWLGHAAGAQGTERVGSMVSYGCHVLGAGAWLGGLVPLLQKLRHELKGADAASMQVTLERFSHIGMIAVTLIIATGVVNTYLRSVTVAGLIATEYGRVLVLKVLLFVVLLGVAAATVGFSCGASAEMLAPFNQCTG